MKQRGQQNALAPPPTLVAPKFGSSTGVPRRPVNAGKGVRIEAPPPLSVPPSTNTSTQTGSTATTTTITTAPQQAGVAATAAHPSKTGLPPAQGNLVKPRSGSFSVATVHSPRQKYQSPSGLTTNTTTATTEVSDTATVLSPPLKGSSEHSTEAGAATAPTTTTTTTRTIRASSVAEPRAEPHYQQQQEEEEEQQLVGERVNASIPLNLPVIKKAESFMEDKGGFTAKVSLETLPDKEVFVPFCLSTPTSEIHKKVNTLYYYYFFFTPLSH